LPAVAAKLGQCKFVFFTFTIKELSELLQQRLRQAFANAGLSYDQFVVCLPWQARPAFYDLMKRADVFLDTLVALC
jgi:predicted O-linked N-acetylglucosamine transferase (SPINDLY family)